MAFDYDAPNKPSSPSFSADDPNTEHPTDPGVIGTDGTGGMATSCNPGIGIASAETNPGSWPQAARGLTENGQYIGWGGDSTESGQETADIPALRVQDYAAQDYNDEWRWVQATSAGDGSAKGQTIATGVVSASAVAFSIGDWLWGKVVQAGATTFEE